MGINFPKIMMVMRVNMYWRLETLLIKIFPNFLFYLALGTNLSLLDQDEKVILKFFDQICKIYFSPQADIP